MIHLRANGMAGVIDLVDSVGDKVLASLNVAGDRHVQLHRRGQIDPMLLIESTSVAAAQLDAALRKFGIPLGALVTLT